jgi:hypothetical protein
LFLSGVGKRFNQLSEQYPNFECFAIRKISSQLNPECKCAGGGYCYARDEHNNIIRPCEL